MDQDKATKEQRILKQRVETLERENMLLRKSLYELSRSYNSLAHKLQPFNLGEILDSALDTGINSLLETSETDASPDRFAVNREKLSSKDSKHFYLKQELKGHTGAVYAVQYSPCGRFISSGAHDKTVRIWDQKELNVLRGHTLNVSDLSWSSDSTELVSGAYDQTCKTWDVETSKLIESYNTEGFTQCVMFSPRDKNIFVSGTTRNVLCVTDRRDPSMAMVMRNDSMVNTLFISQDGQHVITGDYFGFIRTWDVRTGKYITNSSTKNSISHIASCPSGKDEEPRYLAMNSFDNVIRVYDRGLAPPLNPYRLVHTLKGYKNRNWTIKSAFFKGRDVGSSLRGTSTDDMFTKNEATKDNLDSASFDKDKSIFTDTLLATGSADPFVYVYSLGLSEGTSELVQRLEGHTDRVYAVSFHPNDPILCSCSADFTIKVWHSSTGKRK